jgi:hypothetical protein
MPDQSKAGIEALSGMDLSDVRVHANSAKPAQLNALAYAQGNDIHLGPGQEKHLPHEAWHVVQQREGRVRPTLQAKGARINDDARLEKEADAMGQKASHAGREQSPSDRDGGSGVVQEKLSSASVAPLRVGIQAKLAVSEPDDLYEQEADRAADAVMPRPAPQVSASPPVDEENATGAAARSKPVAENIMLFRAPGSEFLVVQRKEAKEEREPASKGGAKTGPGPRAEGRFLGVWKEMFTSARFKGGEEIRRPGRPWPNRNKDSPAFKKLSSTPGSSLPLATRPAA